MRQIYVFNCIITADTSSQKVYIASVEKNQIILPVTSINKAKFLFNEIRFNIKNLFSKNTIRFLEEIILSFVDIQNYLLLNYLENSKKHEYIDADDINILCGTILHEKVLSDQLFWIEIPSFVNIVNNKDNDMIQIVKYVFDKMII